MKIGNEAPSRLLPYNVSHINMEMFGVPEFKKLSKALAVDSVDYMVEALGGVLSIDANTLTDGDFHYLFSIQRLEGYSDYPLVLNWVCQGTLLRETGGLRREFTQAQALQMVADYANADEAGRELLQNPNELQCVRELCKLENDVPVTMADLTVRQVPEVVELDPRLDWPRVNTLADSLLLRKDPEMAQLIDAARWVRGDTMNEKIKNLEDGGASLFRVATKASSDFAHGYNRTYYKQCTRCGTEHLGSLHVDAAMFFQV